MKIPLILAAVSDNFLFGMELRWLVVRGERYDSLYRYTAGSWPNAATVLQVSSSRAGGMLGRTWVHDPGKPEVEALGSTFIGEDRIVRISV